MKTLMYLTIVISLLISPLIAIAQAPEADVQAKVKARMQEYSNQSAHAARSTESWWALEKEVNLKPDASYDAVDPNELHQVLFFATYYADKMDFRASVPLIVEIFEKHPNNRMRFMAATTLGAIGCAQGIDGLRRALEDEPSTSVRRTAQLIVHEYAPPADQGEVVAQH